MITKELFDKIINGSSYVTYHFLGDARLSTIFYHFFRTLPGNLYCKDKSGRYFLVSDYLLRSHGFANPNDVVGKTDTDLFCKEEADQLKSNDISVMNSDQAIVFEETITLTDGKKRYYEVIKAPLKNTSGEIIGIVGNSVEVTRRHLIETELRESKQFTSQFIENMEHDLRTPLSGLEGTITSLLTDKEEGVEKQTLEFSLSSVEQLKIIINSILDFENQKYGYKVLNEPFNLSQVFESVYCLYHPTADSKHLKLSYNIDSTIPRVLISDAWRIKHILLNLVGNALKFTGEGEVSFEAKLIRHEDQKVLIEFIVKDTGIGIPDDKREMIFERYVRLDPSNKGRYKGTGLGLANVKEYVEQLSGEFKPIRSTLGKGTTFALLIPMKVSLDQSMELSDDHQASKKDEADNDVKFFDYSREKIEEAQLNLQRATAAPEKTQSTEVMQTHPSSDRPLVLLVEDSPTAQFIGKSVIAGENCQVDVAGTAEEALTMVDEKQYDLIFADIGLPGMDGIEMTRHIRYNERKKGVSPTPIVGQTANANAQNKKSCMAAGMQDVLAKPLTHANVSDVLKNYTQQGSGESTPAFVPHELKNTQVIDHDSLMTIWKDLASLKEIFEETKDSTFEDIDNFKKAYGEKDWKQLLYLAHKVRGAMVYFAASRLEEVFSHFEDYLNSMKGKEPDPKILDPMYQTIVTELDTLFKEVDKLLRNV